MLLLPLAGLAREPAGPQRNLLVELRWVESSMSGSALAGVREGAVVLGTGGSVSPRPGLSLDTRNRESQQAVVQRLLVLNGRPASIQLSEPQPVQWLDYAVQLAPGQQSMAAGARVVAAPRSGTVERLRGFVITPHWPGGTKPVTAELKALNPEAGGQTEVLSTVQLPLEEWLTVARSGAALRRQESGTLSSRDAEMQTTRELQLRISLDFR